MTLVQEKESDGMRVVIPDGVTQIGPIEHRHISTLLISKSVEIPHNTSFSPFASHKPQSFMTKNPTECRKVHISHIENHSPYLAVEDGVLYSADKTRLIYCFEEKTMFVVPASVTMIEPYAFCLQKKLKKIVLHDGIIFIGSAAFMACSSLEEIVIPSQIKCVARDTFDGCTSLCKVILPDGLERIGNDAFRNCDSLTELKLPAGIRRINFEACSALREIDIPASVEEVGGFAFCRSLRKVVLREGVKRIEDYAFRYCDNLAEINFPEGLEKIGARAFYPAALTRLVFPATLKEIGCEAFYYNGKLHSVEFQSHVEEIGQAAFACCPLLHNENISMPDGMSIKEDVFISDSRLDKYGFWD